MELGAITKHDLKKAPRTGEWRDMKPEVSKGKCIGCGTCVEFCPEAVISLETYIVKNKAKNNANQKKVASVDYEFCKGCGVCANVCPTKAINMKNV